jgi:hypothetical protein
MNSPCCCQNDRRTRDDARYPKSSRARRLAELILPGALLTLLPKCPMCLAAYVALGTGFTMSYASAHLLMRTLTALCLGTLALCAARCLVNCSSKKRTINFQPTPAR